MCVDGVNQFFFNKARKHTAKVKGFQSPTSEDSFKQYIILVLFLEKESFLKRNASAAVFNGQRE